MTTRSFLAIITVTLALAFTPGRALAGDGTGTLMITGTGFKGKSGKAIFAVYRQGKHWLEVDRAFLSKTVLVSKAKNGNITVTFRKVPHGEYGITVHHDSNNNGKMDMRWVPYPKPKERAGVSNNWVRKGKPKYSKAKFKFSRRLMSMRIHLH